jgi:hypothetical protein
LRPYLEKPFTKIGLVKWLKVKALSSNPSTAKKKKKNQNQKKKKRMEDVRVYFLLMTFFFLMAVLGFELRA